MHRKSNFLLWTLIVLLVSCWSCSSPNVKKRKRKKKLATTDETKKPYVVLLHGLDRDATVFNTMAQALQQEGWDILKLTTSKTGEDSIKKQAEEVYNLFQTKSVAKKRPVCLVGHSQGGLRAYLMAQRLQQEGYTSVRVVTIGTPWLGVTAMNDFSVAEEVRQIQTNPRRNVFRSARQQPNNITLFTNLISAGITRFERTQEEGVADMKPNSSLIKEVRDSLKQNQIPTLAIAGDATPVLEQLIQVLNLPDTIQISGLSSYTLQDIVSYMLSGVPTWNLAVPRPDPKPHDMLITVASQLAEGITAQYFERATVMGVLHELPSESEKQLSAVSMIPQTKEAVAKLKTAAELESPEVIAKVIAYIKDKL